MKQVNIRIPFRILTLVLGLFLSLGAYAQITVNGLVKDATGEPVIGASVRVVGTQMGTATDFDGNFILEGVPQGAKLQITSVGYDPQEVTAASNVVVTLSEGSQMLQNLVVIGYGVVKKNDLTGSVTALKPDSKNKGVVVSAQDMLGGKIAGVNVTSGGGTPGGGATIRIRGGSSLNASNDPLIVIDGVPMDNSGVKGFPNGLAIINPQDIESFNVLKDASATAIYGSRGSNGVIIITTKKGRRGQRPSVAYNGNVTVSMKKKSVDVMDGDQFREFVGNLYKGNDRYDAAMKALGKENTNWQDQIYRTALSHDHNVTLTGSAGDWLPYRISLGYTDQQGILKTSDFKRFTTALNLNPSFFNDHLRLNLNGKFMWGKNRYADGGAISAAVWMDPTQPVTSTDPLYDNFGGYFEWLGDGSALHDSAWPYTRNSLATSNPVAMLNLRNDRAISRDFIGNADIDYQVHGFEDLRLHLTLGADLAKGKQWTDVDPAAPQATYYGSHGWEQIIKRAYTLSTYAQYYKDFNDDNHFDIMGGYEWQHFWHRTTNHYWDNYPENLSNKDKGVSGRLHNYSDSRDASENYLISFFGRANYIFKGRYYLTATVRDDGSSRFMKHWALFPSFAFAWRINDEPFLRNVTALSDLKLRLGWGKTGQQDIGWDYGWIATYSKSSGNQGSFYDVIGDGSMVRPDTRNEDLRWETTTTTNVGLDYGFMNQRISGSIDWYYRKTTDLINYAYNSAGTQPRNMMNKNIGSLRNTGLEFAISWKAIQVTDWNWTIDYNATWNSNKIIELIGGDDEDYYVPTGGISSGTGNNIQGHAVGYPASSFRVYQQVYDQNGMPIEGQVVDRNGDGQISPDDMYFYKNPAPDVTMGLASRLEWKNWDLGMSFRASLGNYVFNDLMAGASNLNASEILTSTNYLSNRPIYVLPYNYQTYSNHAILTDRWVQNASFLKCDNITLGYSFAGIARKNSWDGISGRVYGTVSNVFCITKYEGIDPEVFSGIDNSMYPRPISFIFGLSLNF